MAKQGPADRRAWFSLPFEPVARMLERRQMPGNALAPLGIHPTRAHTSGVTLDKADEIAALLGVHPTAIWPDDYIWLALLPAKYGKYGWAVEPEPDGLFCGRDLDDRCGRRSDRWWYQDWAA